jgi:hypothetical protein
MAKKNVFTNGIKNLPSTLSKANIGAKPINRIERVNIILPLDW